jgi:glycosyltransferase involved in cell wall biosynthesis
LNRVSVVIPAYNCETFIGRALTSVRNQTVPAHEVIVVDDGSTDRTEQVVREHPEVIYIRQVNRGVSAARNVGIERATGTWVALLDADEEWLPLKTERQLTLLERNPEIVWAACNCERIDRTGRHSLVPSDGYPRTLSHDIVPYFQSLIEGGFTYTTSALLIHRSVFEQVGGFDEQLRISGDRDLLWRVALRFPRLVYDREASLIWHAATPNSITKVSRERSVSLQMFCKNMRRNAAAGITDPAALRYARDVTFSYLTRYAAREIQLKPEVVAEARSLLRLRLLERALLSGLQLLPAPAARLAARLVQPSFH